MHIFRGTPNGYGNDLINSLDRTVKEAKDSPGVADMLACQTIADDYNAHVEPQ